MSKVIKQQEENPSYQDLSRQLNEVLATLQQETLDIDTALINYEHGLELLKQLKDYLETAENHVKKLQSGHSA